MQNRTPKFRQNSTTSEKIDFSSEKLKILMSSNYHKVRYFCWNFAQISYLAMSAKECSGVFLFCWYLELFKKSKKLVCRNQVFFIFTNTSRSKQNKKNHKHPFVDIGK